MIRNNESSCLHELKEKKISEITDHIETRFSNTRVSYFQEMICAHCHQRIGKKRLCYYTDYMDVPLKKYQQLTSLQQQILLKIYKKTAPNNDILKPISRKICLVFYQKLTEAKGEFQEFMENLILIGYLEKISRPIQKEEQYRLRDIAKTTLLNISPLYSYDSQEELARILISNALKSNIDGHFSSLLSEQLKLLQNHNAQFSTGNIVIKIVNSSEYYSKYMILLKVLTTWHQLGKKATTWRELSALAFSEPNWIHPNKDLPPSKILTCYSNDLERIIEHHYNLSINEFGIIDANDILLYCGFLSDNQNGQCNDIFPKNLSYFHLYHLDFFQTNAKTMILIENLSPFLQCCEIFNKKPNKDLVIVYLGGMPTQIQTRLISIFVEKNKLERIVIWTDHDFGGLRITSFIIKKLINFISILSIQYPPSHFEHEPYRNSSKEKIRNYIENENELIRNFGESIIKRGEYEQELFITDFITNFF